MASYLTVDEFKQAPTAVDVSSLDQTNIGNQAAQDNALANVITRASAWVDNIVKYSLQASTNTETKELHFTKDGRLTIHPNNVPVLGVSSVAYRTAPAWDFIQIDPTMTQVYDEFFAVFGINQNVISPALVLDYQQMGYYSPYMKQRISEMPVTVQYTYTNGYFNALLTQTAEAGASSIVVDNPIGLLPNSQFTLFDGAFEETCTVTSVNGNTVTLQSPLLFTHNQGTSASAIPAVVKQATILLASYLIKERGAASIVMNETAMGGVAQNYSKREDVDLAKELLKPLMRVVVS